MASSTVGVMLGGFLARLDTTGVELGGVISAGFAGAALAALVATFAGDRLGRARLLAILGLFAAAGTAVFALASSPVVLGGAAFVGMVNGMGQARGAALILEQAALPGTAPASDDGRCRACMCSHARDRAPRARARAMQSARWQPLRCR